MKIVFDPSKGKGNRYIDIIVEGLTEKGYEIYSLKQVFKSLQLFFSVRIVHLNWFDNLNTRWDFVKRIFKFSLLLLSGKKIVWTMHNRLPHNDSMARLSRILIRILLSTSSKVVVHCKVSEEIIASYSPKYLQKTVYIPHPHYIGEYGSSDLKIDSKIESKVLQLLFIGAVKPYKNIELLIEVMEELSDKNVHLTLAGKPHNSAYKNQLLQRLASVPVISSDLRFIEDDELIGMIQSADLLVLPYDLRSSLNSGTVLLAFSNAKTVICPTIGTILDYNLDKILTYSYSSPDEHKSALKQQIMKAIDLHSKSNDVFHQWGQELFTIVSSYNDKNKVVEQYDKLYKSLS